MPTTGPTKRPLQFKRMRTTLRRFLILALLIFAHPTLDWILIGAGLIVLGQIVHFHAAGTLVKTEQLTIAGPYRHVRNPFYVGSFLTDLGFCCAAHTPIIALIWMPLFYVGVIHPRTKTEEELLLSLHGEPYREFLEKVPRYVPSPWPRIAGGRGQFTWARLVLNGEPSRQLHHIAVPAFMYAKLRLIALQGGELWSLRGFPDLLHDPPGRAALIAGVALTIAPWVVRQVRKLAGRDSPAHATS